MPAARARNNRLPLLEAARDPLRGRLHRWMRLPPDRRTASDGGRGTGEFSAGPV
jgi:hypothetical protein